MTRLTSSELIIYEFDVAGMLWLMPNRVFRLFRMSLLACALPSALLLGGRVLGEIRIPAYTAYLEPDAEGARVRASSVSFRLERAGMTVLWFGEMKAAGAPPMFLSLRLPTNVTSRLRLTVAGQSREATAKPEEAGAVRVDFGSFEIATPGYQRFTLESLNPPGQPPATSRR